MAANEVLETETLRLAGIVAAEQAIATSTTSLEDCRLAVCSRAQLSVGGDGAVIELADGDDLVFHTTTGSLASYTGLRIKVAGSLSGRALLEGRPLSSEDTTTDPRVDAALCARVGIRSMVVVPLGQAGGIGGVLKVTSNRPGAFDSVHLATLELMAPLATSQLVRIAALEDLTVVNRALVASEDRARRLAALSPDAVVIIDADERIVYANLAAAALIGATSPEALVDIDADRYFNDDAARHRRRQAVLTCKRVVHGSIEEVRTYHGAIIPIEISSAPYEHAGRVAVLSVFRDISERMAVATALAASEARWRSAFEAAPVGIVEIDARGRFIAVNAAFCALVGHRPERLSGSSIDLVAQPHKPLSTLIDAVRTGPGAAALRVEHQLVHADGHSIWVDLSATALPGRRDDTGRVLCQVADICDRKQNEIELQHLADHDPLTGLRNRRSFNSALSDQASRVARYGPQGALMVMDLDRFKMVNDTHGHSAGDQVIMIVADVLRCQLRNTDVIGRLGGDEFAVMLPFLNPSGARVVAEKLVTSVREALAQQKRTSRCQITTSIGVAFFDDPERSGDDVLVSADLMMYAAKRAGGNRYTLPIETLAPIRPSL